MGDLDSVLADRKLHFLFASLSSALYLKSPSTLSVFFCGCVSGSRPLSDLRGETVGRRPAAGDALHPQRGHSG